MKRVNISENFGLYKVAADGWQTTGASLESALRKAYEKQTGGVRPGALDNSEPQFDDLSAWDLLEVLMGSDQPSGQIHTGIVSG